MRIKCLWPLLLSHYYSLHNRAIYVHGRLCEVVSDHSLGIIKATGSTSVYLSVATLLEWPSNGRQIPEEIVFLETEGGTVPTALS